MAEYSATARSKTFWIVAISVLISACLIGILLISADFVTRFFGQSNGTPEPFTNVQEQVIEALKAIAVPAVGLIGAGIGFYFGSNRLKRGESDC